MDFGNVSGMMNWTFTNKEAESLAADHILWGDLEGFSERRYLTDRIVARAMSFAGETYQDITYPHGLEAVLVPGEVVGLVMTAVRDVSTIMAVMTRDRKVHLHPELGVVTPGFATLARLVMGNSFATKLTRVQKAIALMQSYSERNVQ